MDGFPDELREVVHEHWGTFPPQHPMIVDFFGILFFFFWCIAFFGNGCVIYIFLTTKSLRTPVSEKFYKKVLSTCKGLLSLHNFILFIDQFVYRQLGFFGFVHVHNPSPSSFHQCFY